MKIEKLSKINILIQRIVFDAGCVKGGNLTATEIVEICREIVKEADSE